MHPGFSDELSALKLLFKQHCITVNGQLATQANSQARIPIQITASVDAATTGDKTLGQN